MFQKSALPGSPYSPTPLYSLLASQKTDLVHVFNTIFNVFMCIVLSLGQYSKCLHLFDVSRVMPLFCSKAEFSPLLKQQNVKSTRTQHAWHTQTGGPGPDCTQTFPISIQKSEALLQSSTKEYIIPTGKTQKGV